MGEILSGQDYFTHWKSNVWFILQQKKEAAADKLLVELENDFWKEMVPVRFLVS